ncbi:MAG TPA: hypothetical protein VNI84_07130 [Pyrinomonadaceae bacterium]|nr:hypothetical protein [Pyrinomonadaceae bacterium]
MKNKIILTLSVIFILALGIVAFAVNQSNNSNKTATDSCAMKMQSAGAQAKTSCCDKADCCCKGDSCPMKTQGENASSSCCSNCCGDSCPMKDKQAQTGSVDMKNVMVVSGESCCSGGACCKNKQNKS